VRWDRLPEDATNGIITGYRIRYRQNKNRHLTIVAVDGSQTQCLLSGKLWLYVWFLPVPLYACTCTCYGPVSVSVCLSQVGVLSKEMNRLIWFWHGIFFRPVLHCVLRKFSYLLKYRYFSLELFSKLWILPPHIGPWMCCLLSSRKVDKRG